MRLKVHALDHLVIHVTDVETSAAWYERVLGMTREHATPEEGKFPRTAMRFGQQKINLRPVAASKEDWFTATMRRPAATTFASSRIRRRTRSFSTCKPRGSRS